MSHVLTVTARLGRRLSDDRGSMLLELLMAMTFLAIAVGALMAIYATSIVSMRHTSTEGNALTLADKQIEVYKTLQYASVQLSAPTIPSGSDPYVTASSTDSTIPSSTGEVTGGTATTTTCSAPATAQPECAVQYWTGPDGLAYRIDTYIVAATPAEGGRPVKQVTVAVRRVTSGTPSSAIWARATTTIDLSNPPQ